MRQAIATATDRSKSWRLPLPRAGPAGPARAKGGGLALRGVGSARYLTGAVPGRRLTKSPPVSVGSVRTRSSVARRRRSSARIQGVEEPGVLLVDHVALDLERRRELARLLREVVVEDAELLDLLDLGVVRVDAVDLALDELDDLRVRGQRGHRGVLDALLTRPRKDLLLVERDQRDGIRPPVAVHHALRDPARLLHLVLEVRRRQVLAARGDDDVLLAPDDRHVAVLVDRREVAGVQPPVDDRAERGVRILVVAGEDVLALDEQLAVVGDLELDAGQRPSHRPELVRLGARG